MRTTTMILTRVTPDGAVTETEIEGVDLTDGQATFAVDADVEAGDQLSYALPNRKARVLDVVTADVLQSPFGDNSLDHTLVKYQVAGSGAGIKRPQKVDLPGLHSGVSAASGRQFAQGIYDDAVFAAFKAVEARVQDLSGSGQSGKPLMTSVFNEQNPSLDTASTSSSGRQREDELEGFKFLFMGAAQGIRNAHAHRPPLGTSEDEAREMLALASLLMRALDRAEARKATQGSI